MFKFQKAVFSTETGGDTPALTLSQRSGVVDETSPTVCVDYSVYINCRVDTTGNADPLIFELGNTVYNNVSGNVKFDGENFYYMLQNQSAGAGDYSYICQINSVGVITDIFTSCLLP